MFKRKQRVIQIKTDEQVQAMRAAGLVVGSTLEVLRAAVAPGVSTSDDAWHEHQ